MSALLSLLAGTAALQQGGVSTWVWILLILVIVVLLLWWLGRQEERGKDESESHAAPPSRPATTETAVVAPRGEAPPLESIPLNDTTPEVEQPGGTKTVQVFEPSPEEIRAAAEETPIEPKAIDVQVDQEEVEAAVEAEDEAQGTGAFEFAPPDAPPVEAVPGPQEGFPDIGVPQPGPAQLEDLEIIEGIGPKIASVLRNAGVDTYAQLAAMQPAEISNILHAAGLRLADPRSWPEQARLLMEGKYDEFKALTDSLRGGRQV